MATYTIYGGTTDGYSYAQGTAWGFVEFGSRAGFDQSGTAIRIGAAKSGLTYLMYEGFIPFPDVPLATALVGSTPTAQVQVTVERWNSFNRTFGVALAAGSLTSWYRASAFGALTQYGTWDTTRRYNLNTGKFTLTTNAALTSAATAGGTVVISFAPIAWIEPTGTEYLEMRSADYTGTTSDPVMTVNVTPTVTGWHLYVGGSDYVTLSDVRDLTLIDSGPSSVGRLRASIVNTSGTAVPSGVVSLLDGDNNTLVWRGTLDSRRLAPAYATGQDVEIECADVSAQLDRRFIGDAYSLTTATDQSMVQSLINAYGTALGLSAPTSTVASTRTIGDTQYFDGKTLRQALQTIADAAVTYDPDGNDFYHQSVVASTSFRGVTFGTGTWAVTGYTSGYSGGTPYKSTSGYSWSSVSQSVPAQQVAYGNGYFVASGSGVMYASTNATSWSTATAGTSVQWQQAAFGTGTWVAVGNGLGGTAYVATSTSGTAWTVTNNFPSVSLSDIAYVGSTFVAVGGTGTAPLIYTSTNGTAWSTATITGTGNPLRGISASSTAYVAVGDYGTVVRGTAAAGPYTAQTEYDVINLNCVAWSSATNRFIAAGSANLILQSATGTAWYPMTIGSSASTATVWNAVHAENGKTIIVGSDASNAVIATNDDTDGVARTFFVDPLGQLNYGLLTSSAAPYAISDSPNGTTSIAASDLSVDYDESGIVNAVWTASADVDALYSGWVTDATSIATYGRRDGVYIDDTIDSAAKVGRFGRSYLSARKDPIARGSFTVTGKNGWKAGQTVTITNAALGLSSATFLISEVETRFLTGTALRQYRVSFGGLPKSLVRAIASE